MIAKENGLYGSYFLEEENGKRIHRPLVSLDGENAEYFVSFLQSFYEEILKFSASLSMTSTNCSNEICMIYLRLTKLS